MICQKRTKHPKSVRNTIKAVQKHSGEICLRIRKKTCILKAEKICKKYTGRK